MRNKRAQNKKNKLQLENSQLSTMTIVDEINEIGWIFWHLRALVESWSTDVIRQDKGSGQR